MLEDLVTLQTFGSAYQADLARGLLESFGIEVFLADQNVARIEVPGVVGFVRLQVRESDLAEAQQILASTNDPIHEED